MSVTTGPVMGAVKGLLMLAVVWGLPCAGLTAEAVKIGVLLPTSGVFGGLGKDQILGLEMGFDDFGQEVADRPIKLIKADTESKPGVGLAQFKKLVLKEKVDVVVGIISSAVAGAVRDYAHRSRTPLIISNAGNDDLTGRLCSPWIVRTSFSNAQISRPSGPYLAGEGYRKAFLMAFDYAAGHQAMNAFRAGFESAGGRIVGEEYPPLGETRDFGPWLAKIKAADPDVAYVFFAGGPAIKFVKEWAAFGLKDRIRLAGPGWLTSALYVKKQGDDALGVLGALNYVPSIDNPENAAFQQKFRARHGRDGSEFGVAAYDSARLIVEALKATGGRTDDKAALVAAMGKVRFNGPRGPFRIDPKTHNVIQNIYLSEVQSVAGNATAVVQHGVQLITRWPGAACRGGMSRWDYGTTFLFFTKKSAQGKVLLFSPCCLTAHS